jgi:uncharacterized protein YggE
VAQAQTTSPRKIIRAIGEATVTATPDYAQLAIAVDTRGATAQEAAAQNATVAAAVLQALKSLLGANADISTVNYTLAPVYNYPPNGAPTLTGYTVSNTIQINLTNLAIAGQVIDTATQAGANRIQSLSFTLKDPDPVKAQALQQAVQRARNHANAMALGLGLHLGNVAIVQENGSPQIVPVMQAGAAAAATTTPIQTGTVSVSVSVTVDFEIS